MKTIPVLAAALVALGAPQAPFAQSKAEATAVKAVQITQARKANAALMRQYSWSSRTELIEQGAVKDTRIELVNYGPGGQLQRTLVNDQGARLPIGFLRRAIAENERKKMEEYLHGLRSLLEEYTLPTAGKVLDFMSAAQITGPDASGEVEMTGRGVVMPGDTFSVWSDARTRQTRKIQVATVYQGDVANLTATFATLPSKLTYVAYAEVTVPAKQLSVQVQNFNFNRGGVTAPQTAAAASAPAAARPAATVTVTETVRATPAPAAAPAVSSSQAATVQKLKELKSLLDRGVITQSQYNAESQTLLNELVQ
jgi:hypothetical protein